MSMPHDLPRTIAESAPVLSSTRPDDWAALNGLEQVIKGEDKEASKWWLKQVTAAMEVMAISLADAAARDSERTRKATKELRSIINGHSERLGEDGETILAEIGTRLK